MRESLTVLAGILILCLCVALGGPYLVDWNAQRGLIEGQLSKTLGEKVVIRGPIDLKLLPTPYFHLQNLEIADEAAAASFKAEDVFLEIAIPPLMRGEIDFIEARIRAPRLKLTQAPDGTLRLPQPTNFSGQASFERIAITDGDIRIEDPAQASTLSLAHFNLNAEASSLEGPFKGDGSGLIGGETTGFRFSTGPREGDTLRLKLIVDKSKTHPRADFDGALSFDRRRNGQLATSFAGRANFADFWQTGSADKPGITVPWHLSGPLKIAGRDASMATIDLRLGEEDHAINVTGTAELDFSAAPKADANLRARQIDIDRLLTNAEGERTTLEQSLAGLADQSATARFPVPLTLDIAVDTATLNTETLTDLSGALVLNRDQPVWLRFESSLPGRSHLHLDGRVEGGDARHFDGKIEASLGDIARLNGWLDGVLPSAAQGLRQLPFRSLEINGETSVSQVGFSGHDLNLRLDRSILSGALSYTKQVGGEPARLFVDMSAPTLDLDGLPDLQDAAHLADAADLSIRFDAHAAKLAGLRKGGSVETGAIRLKLTKNATETKLEELVLSGVGGAAVSAHGQWTNGAGSLDAKLNAPKFGDLTDIVQRLAPNGVTEAIDRRAAVLSPLQLDIHAEATKPVNSAWPALTALTMTGGAGATRLAGNFKSDPKAPSIGIATASADAPDASLLLRQLGLQVLSLNGLGRGHIEIKTQGPLGASPDTSLQANLGTLTFGFNGRIEPPKGEDPFAFTAAGQAKLATADLSPLLQATGLAFPDLTAKLGTDVTGDIDLRGTRVDVRNLKGTLAGTMLAGHAVYAHEDGARKLTGTLDLDKSSAGALLELALGPPQPAKAGSLWSNLAFGSGLPDPPQTSLLLHIKSFDMLPGVSGNDAALQLEITPGTFVFRDFTLKTGNGTMAGTITLRRDGPTAALAGHVSLDNYGFDLPSLRARVSAGLDLAGSGPNPFALMSSLAGSGHASLAGINVRRSDPGALFRVFNDVEHDKLSIDEAEIQRGLGREFDRATLAAGTRPFDLSLAAGILRLVPLPVQDAGSNQVSLDELTLSLDLRSAAIDQRLAFVLQSLPRDWQGPQPKLSVVFKGALTNPARSIESGLFVNALAARSIAREAARIQAYEFDLHERAVFNQRLISDRRRDQERQKAEDDARRAAEAARKAEEAARLEKLRKAEDARKAEEARRKAEEQQQQRAAPASETTSPASGQQNNAAQPNALQPQPPGTAVDPSTAGRY